MRRDTRELGLSLSTMNGHIEKVVISKPGKEPSPIPAGTLIWNFQSPELWTSTHIFCVVFHCSTWTDQDGMWEELDPLLLPLKTKEGDHELKKKSGSSGSWKSQGADFPQILQKGTQPTSPFIFTLEDPFLTSDLKTYTILELCCFKPLNL